MTNNSVKLYREVNKLFEAMQYIRPANQELKDWLGDYFSWEKEWSESEWELAVIKELGLRSCIYETYSF